MSPKSNNLSLVGIIGIVILLLAVGLLVMNNASLKKELNQKKEAYLELEKVHTELDQNYEAALQDLEELRGDNQLLNELIDAQKNELAKQKQRISGLIWTERELGKARKEMENLKKTAEGYIAELKDLKENNAELLAANQDLNLENSNLAEELKFNKQRVSNLDSLRKVLVASNEKFSSENNTLTGKVDIAEAIKINYIEVKGLDDKGDGNYKEKGRAKAIDVLRTCFTTETNVVTPAGEHEFFLRLTSPAGELLYVEELGSGVLKNKLTGDNVRYTTSGMVQYNNEDTTACIDFQPNFGLMSGTYQIEIFHNGYNVGNGSFKLK